VTRSRRGDAAQPPLYARVLRLRNVAPSGFLCFIFLEGAVALGVLLALAELVSWWGVLVLPLTVALMVKLNDVIAGALSQAAAPRRRPAVARPAVLRPIPEAAPAELPGEKSTTRLPSMVDGVAVRRPWAERLEAQQQRVRQSATRRYE
jgi:hypothetical protein